MKKLLSLLGALGLAASAGSAVIACGNTSDNNKNETKNLSDIVKDKTLDEINFKDVKADDVFAIILNGINEKNKLKENVKLTSEDVWMSNEGWNRTKTKGTATIEAKPGSEKFTGKVEVNFKIKANAAAYVDNKVVNLGEFPTSTFAKDATIYELSDKEIIKKLIDSESELKDSEFKDKIHVENNKGSWNSDLKMGTATITIDNHDGVIKAVYFVKGEKKVKTDKVITTKALTPAKGEKFDVDFGKEIKESTLVKALKNQNPNLEFINDNQISVKNIEVDKDGNGKAKASINLDHFEDAVDITFKVNKLKDLSSAIKVTDLGKITIKSGQETVDNAVAKAVKAKNTNDVMNNINITDIHVIAAEENEKKWTADIKIDNYSDSKEVTFTLEIVKNELSDLIKDKNVTVVVKDASAKPTKAEVKAAVIAKNQDAKAFEAKITVKFTTEGKANATIADDDFTTTPVEITYTTKVADKELSDLIAVRKLTVKEATNDKVKEELISKNSSLKELADKITVKVDTATKKASVTIDAEGYSKTPVEISYTIALRNVSELIDAVAVKVEGADEASVKEDQVKAAIFVANPKLKAMESKVEITVDLAGKKATVKVTDPTFSEETEDITYTLKK